MSSSTDQVKMDVRKQSWRLGILMFTFVLAAMMILPLASAQEEPIIDSNLSLTVNQDEEFTINATVMGDDAISNYQWDIDDSNGLWWEDLGTPGTDDKEGNENFITHTFTDTGTYNITLRVTDSNGDTASATWTVTVKEKEAISTGAYLAAIGAGLAIGIAGMGAGIGVGITGATGAGTVAEKPEMFGKSIVFQALPQTQAIYGLLIAIMILMSTGLLGGEAADVPVPIGLVAIGCGLAVGLAGLSAIGQGIAAGSGISATAGDPKMLGKGIVFSVLPETQAIYGLLVAILLMQFSGLLGGDFDVVRGLSPVGLVAIGCGLSIGIAGLSAIGQGIAASGGVGATASDPKMFGKGIVFSVLPETQAIYGLLVAILLMAFGGLFAGDIVSLNNAVDSGIGIGLVAVGCGLSIGIAGLSAIGQGIAASGGVGATSEDPKMFGKGIVFSVLPETQAIYGLLIAILLMAFTGMFDGNFTATQGMGLAALGAGLAIGISGLSAIGQGITASAGIGATARNPQTFGRSIIFSVMSETFAIFGLLIAILIMFGVNLMGG